jgi:hypothetical protein
MAVVEAELKRRDATLSLVNWLLSDDVANTDTGKSDPVIDFGARARLVEIRDALVAGVDFDTGLLQGLTLAELVALMPLPVDAGVVTVTGTQTDALTDTELRATPVPVDTGLVVQTDALTDAQLRAAALDAIVPVGVISSENSTTTPLAAGASFVGTGVEVTDWTSAEITVTSNVASAASGLVLETSPDGVNWDHNHRYTINANANRCVQCTLSARWFRVRYVNGASPQTSFRLQTRFNVAPPAPHFHMVDHTIDDTHPAQITRAILTGKISSGPNAGTYRNVTVNPQGRLDASVAAHDLDTPIGPTAFTTGFEDPDGNLAVGVVDANGVQLVDTGLAQGLTDTELRAAPVTVDTGLATQLDALTDVELRATPVPVSDDFPAGEVLPDQTGAAAVLTFTFAADVQTVWVYAVDPLDLTGTGEVRVQPFVGDTAPSATFGIPVPYGGAFPIPAVTDEVRVFAPAGARVTVYGNRR